MTTSLQPKVNSTGIRYNTIDLTGIRPDITPEGFYIFRDVKVARLGLFPWLVAELEQDGIKSIFPELKRNETVYLQRDSIDEEMLKKLPPLKLTNDHPRRGNLVTPKNAKEVGVGSAANPYMDGEWLKYGIIVVEDESAISEINSGKVELSIGYTYQTPVYFEKGLPYVAKEVILRLNHIAIVKRGRAGSECRFNELEDSMSEEVLKQIGDLSSSMEQFKGILSGFSLRLNSLEKNKQTTEKVNEPVPHATNATNQRANSSSGIGSGDGQSVGTGNGGDAGVGTNNATTSETGDRIKEPVQETTQTASTQEVTRTNSGESTVSNSAITLEQVEQFVRENDMFFTATTDMQTLLKQVNTNGLIGLRDGKEFSPKDKTRINKLIDDELAARKTQEDADKEKARLNSAATPATVSLNDALGI